MNSKLLTISLSAIIVLACEFNVSVNKDLTTGLATQGNGISCERVYISDGDNKISRTSFIYAETFYLNFEDVEGFRTVGDKKFPGMQMVIVNQTGDTVLVNDDLYESYSDGMDFSPLVLQANVMVANPIHSHGRYTLFLEIWDKKGEGTFNAKLDFDVVPNDKIKIEAAAVSYDEIYLFSEDRNVPIIDSAAYFYENIYIFFEGLKGFKEDNGKNRLRINLTATDGDGKSIINQEHVMINSSSKISDALTPSFFFTDRNTKNPVTLAIKIADLDGESGISATTQLNLFSFNSGTTAIGAK